MKVKRNWWDGYRKIHYMLGKPVKKRVRFVTKWPSPHWTTRLLAAIRTRLVKTLRDYL